MYSIDKKPTMNELYVKFIEENPEWIKLGLRTVNQWGTGIDGVRVPLQMVIGIALKEIYEKGLAGEPAYIPPPPRISRAPRPMPRQAPEPVEEPVRRSRPPARAVVKAPPAPPVRTRPPIRSRTR